MSLTGTCSLGPKSFPVRKNPTTWLARLEKNPGRFRPNPKIDKNIEKTKAIMIPPIISGERMRPMVNFVIREGQVDSGFVI
jgi:hypothetical protein